MRPLWPNHNIHESTYVASDVSLRGSYNLAASVLLSMTTSKVDEIQHLHMYSYGYYS